MMFHIVDEELEGFVVDQRGEDVLDATVVRALNEPTWA